MYKNNLVHDEGRAVFLYYLFNIEMPKKSIEKRVFFYKIHDK